MDGPRNHTSGLAVAVLIDQLRVAWSLAEIVLVDLTDHECLWTPAHTSWTVRRPSEHDPWIADWEEPEPHPPPTTSLAWQLWHTIWWWSMVTDYSFGQGALRREDITWPGAGESLPSLRRLHDDWVTRISELADRDLAGNGRTHWPYSDRRPFGHVIGWVNVELMKNVAEMRVMRQLVLPRQP